MKEKLVIYHTDRQLERLENNIREAPDISDGNKMAILDFYSHKYSTGLSPMRLVKYLDMLQRLARMLKKDFRAADRQDIVKLVGDIERNRSYGEWTKHDYKVVLKHFYKWLRGEEDYPGEVKWIRTSVKHASHRIPEELLTEAEVQQLVSLTEHPRDKALLAVLYESGCRIGEILTLRLKHVQPDRYGAKVVVNGKTGMRSVRLVAATPYLLSWMNLHPLRDNLEAPIWIELRKKKEAARKAIDYRNASILIKRLATRAGIKKRVHPHLFRHSRATHLAKHLTEAQMKEHFGWVQSSEMAGIYVHLSGRDVDDALLKTYGLRRPDDEKQADLLKPRFCPRCNESNAADSRFCSKCSLVLDMKEAIELEEKRRAAIPVVDALRLMLSDPGIQRTLEQNGQLRSRIEGLLHKD
jgi:site-specific recombinase XerD